MTTGESEEGGEGGREREIRVRAGGTKWYLILKIGSF